MSAYINYLNELTNKNRSQYNEFINQIKWIGYYEAAEREEEKARIIHLFCAPCRYPKISNLKISELYIKNLHFGS